MRAEQENLEARVKDYYRYVEEYDWTRAADRFVGLETFFHRARRREILKLVARVCPRPRLSIDVGCGTALITRSLAGRVVGVDLNPRNLDKARGYAPGARFALCDAEAALPFRDGSFDLAVCTEMLEHLIHPRRTVREIFRVLRPGGVLVGSVPGRSPVWKMRSLSRSKDSFAEEPYHKHYRRTEVAELLAAGRFRLTSLYSKNLQMNWFFAGTKEGGA